MMAASMMQNAMKSGCGCGGCGNCGGSAAVAVVVAVEVAPRWEATCAAERLEVPATPAATLAAWARRLVAPMVPADPMLEAEAAAEARTTKMRTKKKSNASRALPNGSYFRGFAKSDRLALDIPQKTRDDWSLGSIVGSEARSFDRMKPPVVEK
eukprot:Skav201558  [mRNA]  locus=scaffold1616:324052:325718:+ [translate_table: standard]